MTEKLLMEAAVVVAAVDAVAAEGAAAGVRRLFEEDHPAGEERLLHADDVGDRRCQRRKRPGLGRALSP